MAFITHEALGRMQTVTVAAPFWLLHARQMDPPAIRCHDPPCPQQRPPQIAVTSGASKLAACSARPRELSHPKQSSLLLRFPLCATHVMKHRRCTCRRSARALPRLPPKIGVIGVVGARKVPTFSPNTSASSRARIEGSRPVPVRVGMFLRSCESGRFTLGERKTWLWLHGDGNAPPCASLESPAAWWSHRSGAQAAWRAGVWPVAPPRTPPPCRR